MSARVSQGVAFIKKQPLVLLAVAVAVAGVIGVLVYSARSESALQNQQNQAQTKLASQIEQSKKTNEERKVKLAAKAAEEKAAAEAAAKKATEEKAAAEAAAKKAAEAKAAAAKVASTSISLKAGTLVSVDGKNKIPVSWTAGFTSEKGFKLVWSNSPNPTYPGSDYQYLEKSASSGSSYVKASSGTYYIRVCEYLGNGACGRYSNQVTVNVP